MSLRITETFSFDLGLRLFPEANWQGHILLSVRVTPSNHNYQTTSYLGWWRSLVENQQKHKFNCDLQDKICPTLTKKKALLLPRWMRTGSRNFLLNNCPANKMRTARELSSWAGWSLCERWSWGVVGKKEHPLSPYPWQEMVKETSL